ncbi:MAG TPA: NifB/NifX family molybdenum-iron cluster-binding protein [Candidatus Sulfotelmatobacter sp.]|nr:NifB/NifX family molybdenum-iron cluster-binding protein [Candidatus Sulfotelmatobacter sp.]
MRIAIPISDGRISQHFGHSEQFLFVDADIKQRTVLSKSIEKAPEHAPGLLPKWLIEHGVDTVIAVGLGARARDLLSASSVKVLTGVTNGEPDALISDFLHDRLETGANGCDHSGHQCHH